MALWFRAILILHSLKCHICKICYVLKGNIQLKYIFIEAFHLFVSTVMLDFTGYVVEIADILKQGPSRTGVECHMTSIYLLFQLPLGLFIHFWSTGAIKAIY